MDTKQTPISVLEPEQIRLLGIFMEQDFDLCNFAKAAAIELAQALAFIGNQAILDAIDFIKEFELSRLAHNAAKARASTVLLLNRFIHRHDSYDPDHLAENAPVSPHARLVTSAASTLARISDLKSTTKNAPKTATPPAAPKSPPPQSPPSTSPAPESTDPSLNLATTNPPATNPSDQPTPQGAYHPVEELLPLPVGQSAITAEEHVRNLIQQRSRRR